MLRRAVLSLIHELWTPSAKDETPYQRMVIGISHAMLGALLIGIVPYQAEWPVLIALWAIRLLMPTVYWMVKEYSDWKHGGSLRDGIEDAAWVMLGAYYSGPLWWPGAVLAAGIVAALLRQLAIERRGNGT